MKKSYLKIASFLFALVFFLGIVYVANPFYKIVSIGGEYFFSEVATHSRAQQKGLGERKDLCVSCAMLFDFEEKGRRAFWMKGMEFDLDILWIADSRVIFIQRNFSHDSLETISPVAESDKVLEINAGLSEQYGFEVGDTVKIY